jgi:hypothetical protein
MALNLLAEKIKHYAAFSGGILGMDCLGMAVLFTQLVLTGRLDLPFWGWLRFTIMNIEPF